MTKTHLHFEGILKATILYSKYHEGKMEPLKMGHNSSMIEEAMFHAKHVYQYQHLSPLLSFLPFQHLMFPSQIVLNMRQQHTFGPPPVFFNDPRCSFPTYFLHPQKPWRKSSFKGKRDVRKWQVTYTSRHKYLM